MTRALHAPKAQEDWFSCRPPGKSEDNQIGKILAVYGKASAGGETLPDWVEGLSFTKADRVQAGILKLQENINKTIAKISNLERLKGEILDHWRLLCATRPDLEAAVVVAFRALGFADAAKAGGADEEDCILDMKVDGYMHGLVEVKGSRGRTREEDIVQCVKWVDKMHGTDGKWPKAIFVSIQYRNKTNPRSKKGRLRSEPNEQNYAKTRKVCIILSYAPFDAIKKSVDETAPDRQKDSKANSTLRSRAGVCFLAMGAIPARTEHAVAAHATARWFKSKNPFPLEKGARLGWLGRPRPPLLIAVGCGPLSGLGRGQRRTPFPLPKCRRCISFLPRARIPTEA